MSPIEKLLSGLKHVKRTGPDRWIASSPTREDRHPSLAIREVEDGRVLIHDFGGDDPSSILAALGMELSDLFPTQAGQAASPVKRSFNPSDLLALVAFEASVVVIIGSDVHKGREISELDYDRLLIAAQRLGDAVEVCRVRN